MARNKAADLVRADRRRPHDLDQAAELPSHDEPIEAIVDSVRGSERMGLVLEGMEAALANRPMAFDAFVLSHIECDDATPLTRAEIALRIRASSAEDVASLLRTARAVFLLEYLRLFADERSGQRRVAEELGLDEAEWTSLLARARKRAGRPRRRA